MKVTSIKTIKGRQPMQESFDYTLCDDDNRQESCLINIRSNVEYQEIKGFGGAFTEAAAVTLKKLSKENQTQILKLYFDPVEGIGYNLGRVHINSCDFSLGNYTCVDENDQTLESFQIERDKGGIVPMIKGALEYADVEIMASPWSPPAYMKTTNAMNRGGKLDPYANAFNREGNGNGHAYDLDKQSPWVWERKFELDSLCYPFWLAVKYYQNTEDESVFDEAFLQAFDLMLQVFRIEQAHAERSSYYHEIFNRDKSRWCGRGEAVSNGGLVWSGYRPSDDKCRYGYYIPGNMFIVTVLTKLMPILSELLHDEKRANAAEALAKEIQSELNRLAVVERNGKKVYALETDGLGNYNLMDDANIPNLLAMPYYEYPYIDKEIYQNTRQYMLSFENPYYFEGKILKGIGSPHTPKDRVWPLSLIIQALTSENKAEVLECVRMLINSTGGTGYIHEAVDKDDDTVYSRSWFAWANSLFAYLVLEKIDLLSDWDFN